jgi:hypothetical protein
MNERKVPGNEIPLLNGRDVGGCSVVRTAAIVWQLTPRKQPFTRQEIDQRFGPRLDRQNRTAERLERRVDTLTEMLGLFVRHQLTLVAHQPSFDAETARLGRARYMAFIKLVEQRLGRADSGEATALVAKEGQV